MAILKRELWTFYEAFSTRKSRLPISPPRGVLGIRCVATQLATRRRARRPTFLLERKLKDLPILSLPTDRPRAQRQSFNGARVSVMLPQALTASLNEFSNRIAVTPFMTLLAAFQLLLYRYTGQEDLVVGSAIANRRRPEFEGLIGFFANTLVLRADLSGKPSFREFLSRVRDACVAADAQPRPAFREVSPSYSARARPQPQSSFPSHVRDAKRHQPLHRHS